MTFARYAVLVDKFHYTMEQIGRMTETQIEEILFHKRDPKTGEIVFPNKSFGKSPATNTPTNPSDPPFTISGNVGDSKADVTMELRHDANWTLNSEKALLINLSLRPEFQKALGDGKLEEALKKLDEKYANAQVASQQT
jgi:hypothetical protein